MNPMTSAALAVLLGGAGAAGMLLILSALPRWRAAGLMVRIGPYLRDIVDEEALPRRIRRQSGMLPASAMTTWQRARDVFARVLGGSAALERRLAQAGSAMDLPRFRGRQLAWSVVGMIGGSVVTIALALFGRLTAPAVLLPVLAAVGAAAVCDALLTAQARRRLARLEEELPTILEFLAFCLSAGEGLYDALQRVSGVGTGELAGELRRVVLTANTGGTLAEAIADLSRRVHSPALSRAADQIVAGLERGAPLAAVLHAQAADAREGTKRALLESAGRKEILMLLPLVFLILPLSVLFAVYPGVILLRMGIG